MFPPHRRPGQEQNLSLQIDALNQAGCEKIYQEKVSGLLADRPELTKLLEVIRVGDTLVIWKLDGTGHPAAGALTGPFDWAGLGFGRTSDWAVKSE